MSNHRILIVDDDLDSTLPVESVLTDAGYEVRTVTDGWEGLMRAKNTQPDLVLLDVKMPQFDGWTFMKFIRAHTDMAEIPVLFLTGCGSDEDRERGLRLGADGYLVKPLEPDALLREVAASLPRV